MTLDDLLKVHKTCYAIAKNMGFHVNTIYQWRNQGFIPQHSQKKIELLTGGRFKADEKA